MSKHHIEKVTCPSCHHEGDFEVWDSINTVLDPAMKEKVLNQSIFLYTCPNCGETFRLNYPTLYHQMEDLVMIYLVPESEVKKTYEIFYEKNALADYRTEKSQVADALMEYLAPQGAIVLMEAEHMCMTMRGVQKPGTKTVTLARRGVFETDPSLEERFFRMLGR